MMIITPELKVIINKVKDDANVKFGVNMTYDDACDMINGQFDVIAYAIEHELPIKLDGVGKFAISEKTRLVHDLRSKLRAEGKTEDEVRALVKVHAQEALKKRIINKE